MVATCVGYSTASTLGGTFGAESLGTSAVWAVAGLVGGPLLGWAGWTVRRGQGNVRMVAGAVIPMVLLGEGLWFALILHYWADAASFLAVGALLTAVLTGYLAQARVSRYWQCAVFAPMGGFVFYLLLEGILDRVIGSVSVFIG
ncbi:DUF6518 family protein [Streptomyces sp. NPDC001089]